VVVRPVRVQVPKRTAARKAAAAAVAAAAAAATLRSGFPDATTKRVELEAPPAESLPVDIAGSANSPTTSVTVHQGSDPEDMDIEEARFSEFKEIANLGASKLLHRAHNTGGGRG
jgi:hypothetical protein